LNGPNVGANFITIGAQTAKYSALLQNTAGTAWITGAGPVTGTGTGAAQAQTMNVIIQGAATYADGGTISGSIPLTVTY
jgi:hypothetical protein